MMAEGGSLDELSLEFLANEIYKCVCKDDATRNRGQFRKARSLLHRLSLADRQKIVSYSFEGKTPLFVACRYGKECMAAFLLDECNADIEQTGIYQVEENAEMTRHEVSPLWCAAVANQLAIVKLLLERGANINSVSDTQSTPVRSACYMTNVEVVKYLVEKGADIHRPNINGGTCLINSVQSVELCAFLIQHGCDVNARDCAGNLALHYAVREGRLATVKLLIENGSDASACNDMDEDAMLVAALRGWREVLEYLLKTMNPERLRVIECYELLGAHYIDEKNNLIDGLELLKHGLLLRKEPPEIPKQVCSELKEAYLNNMEANSVEEYDNLSADMIAIQMQALLTRERILGAAHKETVFGIVYRGAALADVQQEGKCLALWLYALEIHIAKGNVLDFESEQTILALTKIFLDILDNEQSEDLQQQQRIIQLPMVLRVFELLTVKVKSALGLASLSNEQTKTLETLMKLALYLIVVFLAVAKTESEIIEAKRRLHALIMLNPRGENGRTLLHLAMLISSSHISDEFFSYFPNRHMLDWLLDCGADVNALDDAKNTAFMLLLSDRPYPLSTYFIADFIQKFLNADVHVDVRNNAGLTAGDIITQGGAHVVLNNRLSLKCWAAQAIRRHGIKYDTEIPKSLVPFVDVH